MSFAGNLHQINFSLKLDDGSLLLVLERSPLRRFEEPTVVKGIPNGSAFVEFKLTVLDLFNFIV